MKEKNHAVKVRMTFDQQAVIVEMFDNPASREWLSLLPLTSQFDDFAATEKMAYLPEKLKSSGPSGNDINGDFAYYAPGAISPFFTRGTVLATGCFGKDELAKMRAPF